MNPDAAARSPAPTEHADRLRLARTAGVGPITFGRLLQRFGSVAAAIDALPGLARDAGRATPPRIPSRGEAEREMAALHRMGGRFLFRGDPGYPRLLGLLRGAPTALAVLGDPAALEGRCVGVVGARNASANGRRMAELLAADLARAGLVVVSGLARGVDAAAHEGALRAGRTVAAIAGGLDRPYPPENGDLQRRIAEEGGAVVSEAPLGTAPQDRHFPRRNRIIAGLSLGVVVVEAAMHSGTLITATLALEAGREVFAVPGSPLDPRCRGANDLLRRGEAHLVEEAADVLRHLPAADFAADRSDSEAGLSEPRQGWEEMLDLLPDPTQVRAQLLELLSPTPSQVDDVLRRCQFCEPVARAALSELELAGRVEMLPGNRVALIGDEGSVPP